MLWIALLLTMSLLAAGDVEAEPDDLVLVELSTVGVDRMGVPVVLLRDAESDRVVPIWVGLVEAQAIYRALREIPVPRPMTHDLLASVVAHLGATVHEVLIHDLREGTYYGRLRLHLEENGEIRDVDSRPSDALALALRAGAPIRVARKILEEAQPLEFVIPDELDPVVRTLGITVVELTAERRQERDLPEQQGVLVTSVAGDAYEKGLRSGDVIQLVNDQVPSDPLAFFRAVQRGLRTGSVQLTVWRDGKTFEIELRVPVPGRVIV